MLILTVQCTPLHKEVILSNRSCYLAGNTTI